MVSTVAAKARPQLTPSVKKKTLTMLESVLFWQQRAGTVTLSAPVFVSLRVYFDNSQRREKKRTHYHATLLHNRAAERSLPRLRWKSPRASQVCLSQSLHPTITSLSITVSTPLQIQLISMSD